MINTVFQHRYQALTHAGTIFVPGNLDLSPFDPKMNGFPGLMVDHIYVKLGDLGCIGFLRHCVEKQTDRQTHTCLSGSQQQAETNRCLWIE